VRLVPSRALTASDLRLGLSLALARQGVAWGRPRSGSASP
jgi:hypothetical protein